MKKRPLIAILPAHDSSRKEPWVRLACLDAVAAAGGLPVMLFPANEPVLRREQLDRFDGFLIPGGGDPDPELYGERNTRSRGIVRERDDLDLALIRAVIAADKPLLGICRGEQILNVALGGSLYQDISADFPGALSHWQPEANEVATQPVRLTPGGMLRRITGREELMVNTFHHQAVKRPGDGCVVEAVAGDGLVEAFSLSGARWVLGLQWHPEFMPGEESSLIFRSFVGSC